MKINNLPFFLTIILSSFLASAEARLPNFSDQLQFKAQILEEIASVLSTSNYSNHDNHSFEGLGETSAEGEYYLQFQPIFQGDQPICLRVMTWPGHEDVKEVSSECPKRSSSGTFIKVN